MKMLPIFKAFIKRLLKLSRQKHPDFCGMVEMYLKKLETPRVITLPDGSTMSRADLPSPNTRRWVVSRKAAVVKAVLGGLICEDEACERYALSKDEFDSWVRAVDKHGLNALKATLTQKYRHNPASGDIG